MKGKIIVAALILTFLSSCLDEGKETIIMEDEKVEMTGIYRAVPQSTVNKLKEHMPIYEGDNPPNIEGCYLIKPMVAVYCDDGGFSPGTEVAEEKIRFTNQDDRKGTIDYESFCDGTSKYEVGVGAFISGDGNNFTAYFDTEGETEDGKYGNTIKTTKALVISGTVTNSGIKDIRYAFTMVKKIGDEHNTIMNEGGFRVFKDKDGLAANSTWTYSKTSETSINPLPNKTAKSF